MNDIVRKKAAIIRWSLLISLAVECETRCAFSDFPSDAGKVVMSTCELTSINTTELERFTHLQELFFSSNYLTTFPDLSPIAGTLQTLNLYNNDIASINTTLLVGFTKLQDLILAANDLTNFPDLSPIAGTLVKLGLSSNRLTSINTSMLEGFTALEKLYLSNTHLTTFPDLSPIATTVWILYLNYNQLTSINNTLLEGFTNLEELHLYNNQLTTFPDLLPITGTLRRLDLSGNKLTTINPTLLEVFPKLDRLDLTNTDLTTLPDLSPIAGKLTVLKLSHNKLASINASLLEGFTNLQVLTLSGNALTTYPDLSSMHKMREIDLSENSISAMSNDALLSLPLDSLNLYDNVHLKHFPHTANALRYATKVDIHNTGISILPPIMFDNIANVKLLDVRNSVDVCKCENLWLKQEGPKIANFQYDDADCGGQQWSSMTVDDFRKKCEGEKHLQMNEVVTLAEGLKTKMSLTAALLHSHQANRWLTECTARCLEIAGCVSFYYQDKLGDCVIIAPGNSISMASVPDGGEEVWTYFAVP